MGKLSVLLPTYNEEGMIVDCLESVKWADEILVTDSYSTDETLNIARKYGARIIQHEYINSAKQKNWAIPQCSHDWVLQIDADERLDSSLQAEIQELIKKIPEDVDGYRINFKHHLLGRWVRRSELYPEYHLRLFRRDVGRFQDREVDAHVFVPRKVETLHGHILHFGTENISHRLHAVDRYTRYESDERQKRGVRFSWFNIFARPLAAFVYFYFYKLGFLDGVRGLMLAVLKFDFVFWTYAKLWEKEWRQGRRK
jgi:glycosyltransferase involved in cell wall biosynthesis